MPVIAIGGPETIAILQGIPKLYEAVDATEDAAIKAEYDDKITRATSVLNQVTAARDAAVAKAETARTSRNTQIAAALQFVQTGTPVSITLPDDPAPVAPATE